MKPLPDILAALWKSCDDTDYLFHTIPVPYFPLLVGNIGIMIGAMLVAWAGIHCGHLARVTTYVFLIWGILATLSLYYAIGMGVYAKCDDCSLFDDFVQDPSATAWFSDIIFLYPMASVYAYVTPHRWGFGDKAWWYVLVSIVGGPHVVPPLIALKLYDIVEADPKAKPDNSLHRWSEWVYVVFCVLEIVVWLPQFLVFFMGETHCWTWPLALAMWDNPGTAYVAQSISIAGWWSDVWMLVSTPLDSQKMWYVAFALLAFHNLVLTFGVMWVLQAWYEMPQAESMRAVLKAKKWNLYPVVGAVTTAYIVGLAAGSIYIVLDVAKSFGVAVGVMYATVALLSPFGRMSAWDGFGRWLVSRKTRTIVFFASTAGCLAGALAQSTLSPPDLAVAFKSLSSVPVIGTLVLMTTYITASYSLWSVLGYSPAHDPEDQFSYVFKAAFAAPFMFLTSPGLCPIPGVDAIRGALISGRMRRH